MDLKTVIRSIPDFPEPGILFRDITPVLQDGEYLREAVDAVIKALDGLEYDLVLGPESRGFIFGVPVAYNLKKGFVPVRKAGKLPYETRSKSYGLEYGKATIEIHKDAIQPGQRVVVIDDLLATGGTCKALAELVEESNGVIAGMIFLIELADLNGRGQLEGYDVRSVLRY